MLVMAGFLLAFLAGFVTCAIFTVGADVPVAREAPVGRRSPGRPLR